jgi:hypothetical protein
VGQAQVAMDRWYASAPSGTRDYIDAVLDALEADAPGNFRGMGASDRLKHLRSRVASREDELAPAAVLLGAPVIDPDTDTPAVSPNYLAP